SQALGDIPPIALVGEGFLQIAL
ncbi:MAG: hypothetical protein RL533_1444, partial [Pseudomonadota bacterium]